MDQTNNSHSALRHTINPYYRGEQVFERDQSYYTQLLNNTRRNTRNTYNPQSNPNAALQHTQNSRNTASLQPNPVQSVYTGQQYGTINQTRLPSHEIQNVQNVQNVQTATIINEGQGARQIQRYNITPEHERALRENEQLKVEIDKLVNGGHEYGNSQNVVKLSYYSLSQGEIVEIKKQEEVIHELEEIIKRNYKKIDNFKRATEELTIRMNNIQTVDKEIYKNLQTAVNRDKDLLEKATSALARGQSREEVAFILEQIISS